MDTCRRGLGRKAVDAAVDESAIVEAVIRLDVWLETMRGPDGYGGPVAHWWQNCLQFTGVGLDWRYEGIIIGYLNLYKKTSEERWLAKARQAGDDLVCGQLSTGKFRNSCFELNPYTGGTPHEAACDLALLHLAEVLREQGDPAWQTYLATAERNIWGYHIERLWNPDAQAFRDHPWIPGFVPNKAATLVEALLMLARLSGDKALAETYALPTLDAILAHQVRDGPLDGAIYQYSQNGRFVARFFPFYIARCVPGLIAGHEWTDQACSEPRPEHSRRADRRDRYLDGAQRAFDFVLRCRYNDGSFPQVVYPGGRANRYPQWIAATGDILRAMALLKPYGLQADPEPTLAWLLRGREPTGGFRTAHGFASQISQREPGGLPEFRDLLPVVGWSSMAFRYLTDFWPEEAERTDVAVERFETPCVFRGRELMFTETEEQIELRDGAELLYRWRKGTSWAEVCAPELWWK